MAGGTAAAPWQPFGVVVLAASTGGVHALRSVVAGLPASLPVPVLIVQHRSSQPGDLLAPLLARNASVPVRAAASGALLPGVSVLPPATTAALTPAGGLYLRPCTSLECADRLMTSAAETHGPGVLAIVLTGRLSDGAAGARAVRRAGGRVLAQDPDEAAAPGMPTAALATGCVEHVLPLRLIAPAITAYTMAPGAAELLTVPVPPWARLSRDTLPA
ncbi:chemotaxis protein CheB [Modestobacter excelsi]|uniref:chemotaxis protein CheB n=1 Tax=Modestobacter excelsi TaxID=2213161 RepID=UPI00110CC992|nr:chemotaxis protein CheB [Modestobacter excelsi]